MVGFEAGRCDSQHAEDTVGLSLKLPPLRLARGIWDMIVSWDHSVQCVLVEYHNCFSEGLIEKEIFY